MKLIKILFLLNFWTISLVAQTIDFKHDWEIKDLEHDIQLTSKKTTPPPFSTTNEPQAIMIFGASKIDDSMKNDLSQIVKNEIESIKKGFNIIEYLEDDYKPIDHIVSYFEKLNSVQIAIIKYRMNGKKNGQPIMPRSIRQILFIHNDKLYVSSLIVLYAEDQDNMRSDQMLFIHKILENN
ncbi:MAG: hypothetical protein R6V23_00135 [Bacteroidales bacterium]